MLLLTSPRFHIMSQDEINESKRKILADEMVDKWTRENDRVNHLLFGAIERRMWIHKTGIYGPEYNKYRLNKMMWEWYFQ